MFGIHNYWLFILSGLLLIVVWFASAFSRRFRERPSTGSRLKRAAGALFVGLGLKRYRKAISPRSLARLLLIGALATLSVAADQKPTASDSTPEDTPVLRIAPFVVTGSLSGPHMSLAVEVRNDDRGNKFIVSYIWKRLDAVSWPARAGIKAGDRLLAVNGIPIVGIKLDDFWGLYAGNSTARKITLVVQSKNSSESRVIELDYQPSAGFKKP
jgi:hypothetical protein